ncbi:retinaldehyde-binding protein 1-like [Uranotaenia lowii]|uniref:retinaldehyde-binding protein 1-like n=1 Tax=Uranotaenia lowii TaxID=190385 RepID=UPI002478677E|nr:retinaldehyde-binding protein 1-like [Uranotaenia lowii]
MEANGSDDGDSCLYKFDGLDQLLEQISRDELNENDHVRRESLRQMRDWIVQNPRIKNCRTDDSFLLRFLRVRKFSIPRACESLEKYLTMRQTYKKWCHNLDPLARDLKDALNYCSLLPIGRDKGGRIVVLGIVKNFNTQQYNSDTMIRLQMLVNEVLFEDQANQIAGFTHIFDNSDMTMSHVTCWTLENLSNYLRSVINGVPIRLKENHFCNVPSFAAQIRKFCLSFASEKLKSRIHCHRNLEELRQSIDVSVLPQEYGGKLSVEKLNERFREYVVSKREMLLALDQMQIELGDKVETVHGSVDIIDAGAVGSFRKLQID